MRQHLKPPLRRCAATKRSNGKDPNRRLKTFSSISWARRATTPKPPEEEIMGFLQRLLAMIIKEALQLRRDRLTFAMMFGMPIMQLVLFGYAINNDPKGLPTAVLSADNSAITRSLVG